MRMPRGPKLDRLIRFPVEWNQFYLRMEEERRLPELLEALEELPESSVRDVRIARIQVRFGKIKEAKERLYQHKRCPLARSMYLGLVMKNADEDTMRHFITSFKPAGSFGGSILNLEAQYNDYLNVAACAHAVKKIKLANDMYFEALQIVKIMKDKGSERTVMYNMAWMRLYDGQFAESKSTFEKVLEISKPSMAVYDYALDYLLWIAWISGEESKYLPEWSRKILENSRDQYILPSETVFPVSSTIPQLFPIMRDLKQLTHDFYLKLPLMHVQENHDHRKKSIEKIKEDVGEDVGEILGFLSQSMKALAASMDHDKEAASILKKAFKWPSTGIPAMSMVYHANLIQIHANLPHVPMDDAEVQKSMRVLAHQYQHLPKGQQDWVLAWMRDFTPTPLYLLTEKWNMYPLPYDYVIVKPEGVYRGNQTVAKYPRFFMVRHVRDLLSGGKVPDNNRKQAYRHFEALQSIGAPLVIYEPIVAPLRKFLN